jgi:transcriptional regulator with XRE-family HTH domain
MPLAMTFAAFLARRREALHKTQAQVAERCAVTPEAVSMFETARRKPSFESLLYLAEALQVDRQAFCRFALEHRAPAFYATLGLPPVEAEDLESAGPRMPTSNPLLEDDEEEDREESDWTRRAEGQTPLDSEASTEARERLL